MNNFLAVFIARNREFYRDKSSLSWAFIFPLFIIILFAFTFGTERNQYKIGILIPQHDNSSQQQLQALQQQLNIDHVQYIPQHNRDKAVTKISHHQLDLLLDLENPAQPSALTYWVNPSSPGGYFLEKILTNTLSQQAEQIQIKKMSVQGQPVRYLDWVLPGVLAMNMMFSCLFGVGYVIVNYRQNGVLKRLQATPLNAFQFLAAQVCSRLIITLITTSTIFIGCNLFFDFLMLGSYFNLLIVALLGATSLISIGLISACRTSNTELSNGILNIISLPMVFLSGVWFSLEGAHPNLQLVAQWLPLTHLIEATRRIMLEGANLQDVAYNLWVLIAISVISLVLIPLFFRWDKS